MALNTTKLQDETAAVLRLVLGAFKGVSPLIDTMPEDAQRRFHVALVAVSELLGVVDASRCEMVNKIIADTQAMHDQWHAGDFETCPDRWCESARQSRDYRASLED